jgi:DNA (cytosine-5)-methyltransferase 3A
METKPLRVLSLFDGISCARVALGNRPVSWYGASEIDINAIAVSFDNHSDITPLGDVCDVSGVRDIDLLIAGSPCTDLSIAKKDRQGLKGDHSKLFYEFLRILRETKPRYFILENVASMKKEDRDEITKMVGVVPIMIDAALVSAQSRKRYFWTNIAVKGLPEDRNIKLKDILEQNVAEEFYTNSTAKRVMKAVKTGDEKANCLLATSWKGAGANGMTNIGHLGNTNSQGNRIYDTEGKACTLSANGGGLGAKTGLYQVGTSIRAHKIGEEWVNKIEYRNDNKVSALTATFAGKLALVGELEQKEVKRIRKLTPTECERLQSLPDGYTKCLSKTQRYKSLGNAFNVEVIKFILSFLQ